MESYKVKSTAITNDYKRNRSLFYTFSGAYPIGAAVVFIMYGLWPFMAVSCAGALLVYLLRKWAFTLTGTCPYCSAALSSISEGTLLKCDFCEGRIVVRDARFWQRVEGSSLSGEQKLPPGMTEDEFIERKRKIKKQAWIYGGFIFSILVVIVGLGIWLKGDDVPFEVKRMEDLKSAQGVYTIKKIGSSLGRSEPPIGAVLIDEHTQEVLFTGFLMGDASYSWVRREESGEFNGKRARIWYADNRAKDRPMHGLPLIYQLEVEGGLILSLDDANKVAQKKNEGKKGIYVFLFLLCLSFGAVFRYGFYRDRTKKLFGTEE